jgi:hypothetical protein
MPRRAELSGRGRCLSRLSARAPLALVVVIVYLLGTVTGGSLLALLTRSIRGARSRPPDS